MREKDASESRNNNDIRIENVTCKMFFKVMGPPFSQLPKYEFNQTRSATFFFDSEKIYLAANTDGDAFFRLAKNGLKISSA